MNPAGPGRLLVVDDETAQMNALCDTLGLQGYTMRGFNSPAAALAALRPGEHDLLLTDLMMPDMDGITLIAAARQIDPGIGAIVMTGHGAIDTAVQAMQSGALDYITKPFRLKVILPVISRALALQRLRAENVALQEREKRRTEELAIAYQDLEAFSYSVSHDLRTPLLFVKGFAARLEENFSEPLGEEGRNIIRIIRDGSRNMDEMIVGLLAFSGASRMPLHAAPIDMSAVVRNAVAEELGVYVGPVPQIDVSPLPAATGDAAVISHVWSNLIGNALKYSAKRPRPHIRISGHFEAGEAFYKVEDNGAGFDMRHSDKLFGVFKRLHSTDDFPGAGVGLAIVRRIVTRHGGRVWANGTPDAGACIQFTLPAASGHPDIADSQ